MALVWGMTNLDQRVTSGSQRMTSVAQNVRLGDTKAEELTFNNLPS
jgi:hypothetical protein